MMPDTYDTLRFYAKRSGGVMSGKRVVMVVDMQKGVFATPRIQKEKCVQQINKLTHAADAVIFIRHSEPGEFDEGSEGFKLLDELYQPANALYVTKTACDSFYKTRLADVLSEQAITGFVICGCATDYCVDTTLKNGASRGYAITVAGDAHTTAHRPAAQAETLIAHYNDVWRTLIVPDNPVKVKSVETILNEWNPN
jgi:nicotinamidase-related amidase